MSVTEVVAGAQYPPLECSFCGKSQKQVKTLIAGTAHHAPDDQLLCICDECIGRCNKIIEEATG